MLNVCKATILPGTKCAYEDDPWAMLNETRGGFDPREVTDVAVNPIGAPESVVEVITVTPEACLLKVAFRASTPLRLEKSGKLFISDKVRTSQAYKTHKDQVASPSSLRAHHTRASSL